MDYAITVTQTNEFWKEHPEFEMLFINSQIETRQRGKNNQIYLSGVYYEEKLRAFETHEKRRWVIIMWNFEVEMSIINDTRIG